MFQTYDTQGTACTTPREKAHQQQGDRLSLAFLSRLDQRCGTVCCLGIHGRMRAQQLGDDGGVALSGRHVQRGEPVAALAAGGRAARQQAAHALQVALGCGIAELHNRRHGSR
jgi:hypothetical protein